MIPIFRSDPAPRRRVLLALAVFSAGVVGLALVSQYRFDMPPCAWCVFQRLLYLLIAAVALLAVPFRSAGLHRTAAVLIAALGLGGIASAWWQHFHAAVDNSCALSFAERSIGWLGLDRAWPDVFVAWASCADAAVNLMGIPYAFWSLAGFVLCVAGALALWRLAPPTGRGV